MYIAKMRKHKLRRWPKRLVAIFSKKKIGELVPFTMMEERTKFPSDKWIFINKWLFNYLSNLKCKDLHLLWKERSNWNFHPSKIKNKELQWLRSYMQFIISNKLWGMGVQTQIVSQIILSLDVPEVSLSIVIMWSWII